MCIYIHIYNINIFLHPPTSIQNHFFTAGPGTETAQPGTARQDLHLGMNLISPPQEPPGPQRQGSRGMFPKHRGKQGQPPNLDGENHSKTSLFWQWDDLGVYTPIFWKHPMIESSIKRNCDVVKSSTSPLLNLFFGGGGKVQVDQSLPKRFYQSLGRNHQHPQAAAWLVFHPLSPGSKIGKNPLVYGVVVWEAGSLERKNGARHCFGNSNHQMFGCW